MFEVVGTSIKLTRGDYAVMRVIIEPSLPNARAVLTVNTAPEAVPTLMKNIDIVAGVGQIVFEKSDTAALAAGVYPYDIRVCIDDLRGRWITPFAPAQFELLEAVGSA